MFLTVCLWIISVCSWVSFQEEKLKLMQLEQARRMKQRMQVVEANPQLKEAMDHAKHQRLLMNQGAYPHSVMTAGGGAMEPYLPVHPHMAAGSAAANHPGYPNMRDGVARPSTHPAYMPQPFGAEGHLGNSIMVDQGGHQLALEQRIENANAKRMRAADGTTALQGGYSQVVHPGSHFSRRILEDSEFPGTANSIYPRENAFMDTGSLAYRQHYQPVPRGAGMPTVTTGPLAPRTDPHPGASLPSEENKKRKLEAINDTGVKKTKPVHRIGHRNDEQWVNNFHTLKQYKHENGDCLVPRGFDENPALASWVAEQR